MACFYNNDFSLSDFFLHNCSYRQLQEVAKRLKLPGNVKRDKMRTLIQARRDGQEYYINEFYAMKKALQAEKQKQRAMNKLSQTITQDQANHKSFNAQAPHFSMQEKKVGHISTGRLQSFSSAFLQGKIISPECQDRMSEEINVIENNQDQSVEVEAMLQHKSQVLYQQQVTLCTENAVIRQKQNILSLTDKSYNLNVFMKYFGNQLNSKHLPWFDYFSEGLLDRYSRENAMNSETQLAVSDVHSVKISDAEHLIETPAVSNSPRQTPAYTNTDSDLEVSRQSLSSEMNFPSTFNHSPNTRVTNTSAQINREEMTSCCYMINGCSVYLYGRHINEHEKYCPFQIVLCLYNTCCWAGTMMQLSSHLYQIHYANIRFDCEFESTVSMEYLNRNPKISFLQCHNRRMFIITLDYNDGFLSTTMQVLPDGQPLPYGRIDLLLENEGLQENIPQPWCGLVESYHRHALPLPKKYTFPIHLRFFKGNLKILSIVNYSLPSCNAQSGQISY